MAHGGHRPFAERHRPDTPETQLEKRRIRDAHSSLAAGDSDPSDHSDHAAAPLTALAIVLCRLNRIWFGWVVDLGNDGFSALIAEFEVDKRALHSNRLPDLREARMVKYFFDFRSDDALSRDDEGAELRDVEAAHGEALDALVDGIRDIVVQGSTGQHFAVEVRDELGAVLEVAAVLQSKILRTQ
jgi:hypothetical protein